MTKLLVSSTRSKYRNGQQGASPEVYCCEQIMDPQNGKPGSLHAKCITVDNEQVFVSSANFTEAGQDRNIEVGLLVQSPVIAGRVSRFFEALVDSQFFHRAI